MGRVSEDPYSDFVVRVMNSCRIAAGQLASMSEEEFENVIRIRNLLTSLDPAAKGVTRASIVIRKEVTKSGEVVKS